MAINKRNLLVAAAFGGLVFFGLHAPLPILADDHGAGHHHDDDDDEHDHDRALEAVKRGEVLPLEKVLAAVRGAMEGAVVRTKLERKGGVWVYELKIVGSDGRLREIHVDARTAELLPGKGR